MTTFGTFASHGDVSISLRTGRLEHRLATPVLTAGSPGPLVGASARFRDLRHTHAALFIARRVHPEALQDGTAGRRSQPHRTGIIEALHREGFDVSPPIFGMRR